MGLYINPYISVMYVAPYDEMRLLVWRPAAWVIEDFLWSWQIDIDGFSDLKIVSRGFVFTIHDKIANGFSKLTALSFKLTVKLKLQMDNDMIYLRSHK